MHAHYLNATSEIFGIFALGFVTVIMNACCTEIGCMLSCSSTTRTHLHITHTMNTCTVSAGRQSSQCMLTEHRLGLVQ